MDSLNFCRNPLAKLEVLHYILFCKVETNKSSKGSAEMNKRLDSAIRLLKEGIRIFENEFESESKEEQKTILKNATINFGMIVQILEFNVGIVSDNICILSNGGELKDLED